MAEISHRRHRFPPVIIQHAVWLYLRFTLSYRDVEELLAERGLDISYETVRRWVLKFGPAIARRGSCCLRGIPQPRRVVFRGGDYPPPSGLNAALQTTPQFRFERAFLRHEDAGKESTKEGWIPIDSVKRHEVSSTMKTAANFMRAIRGDPG